MILRFSTILLTVFLFIKYESIPDIFRYTSCREFSCYSSKRNTIQCNKKSPYKTRLFYLSLSGRIYIRHTGINPFKLWVLFFILSQQIPFLYHSYNTDKMVVLMYRIRIGILFLFCRKTLIGN